jgi:hypothetical protein
MKFVTKSWKSHKTITICFCILTPSCCILVHISMSLATPTFAHNSNMFLVSCTYNLVIEARTSWNWSITHVVTTRDYHHDLYWGPFLITKHNDIKLSLCNVTHQHLLPSFLLLMSSLNPTWACLLLNGFWYISWDFLSFNSQWSGLVFGFFFPNFVMLLKWRSSI